MAFNSIKDILSKIQNQNRAFQTRLEEAFAVEAWEKTVGPQIAKHARALKVESGVLWVEVDHSVWRTELHLRKRQILEKLNQASGDPTSGKEPLKDLFLIEPKRTGDSKRGSRAGKSALK